jgi:hypothetical protein
MIFYFGSLVPGSSSTSGVSFSTTSSESPRAGFFMSWGASSFSVGSRGASLAGIGRGVRWESLPWTSDCFKGRFVEGHHSGPLDQTRS